MKWNVRDQLSVFDTCEEVSIATGLECKDPSLTTQEAAADMDINDIVRKWTGLGVVPDQSRAAAALYGDFSDAGDFRENLHRVRRAEESFNALDAKVRERFANDPARLIDFLGRPENHAEAFELGLVGKPPPVPPIASQGVSSASAGATPPATLPAAPAASNNPAS